MNGYPNCIERSETVTLIDPSGLGKTTLLKQIAGLETPNRGDKKDDKIV